MQIKAGMRSALLGFAFVLGSSIAQADVLTTFELSGVTFSDGGSATGSFTYDSTNQTLSNVDITTSGGTLPGTTYNATGGVITSVFTNVSATFPTLGTLQTNIFAFNQANYPANEYGPFFELLFAHSTFSLSLPDLILVDLAFPSTIPYGYAYTSSYEVTCGSVCNTGNTNLLDYVARDVAQGQINPTPLPAALPLFATGLGAMGLFGWRRKRKNATAIVAV